MTDLNVTQVLKGLKEAKKLGKGSMPVHAWRGAGTPSKLGTIDQFIAFFEKYQKQQRVLSSLPFDPSELG